MKKTAWSKLCQAQAKLQNCKALIRSLFTLLNLYLQSFLSLEFQVWFGLVNLVYFDLMLLFCLICLIWQFQFGMCLVRLVWQVCFHCLHLFGCLHSRGVFNFWVVIIFEGPSSFLGLLHIWGCLHFQDSNNLTHLTLSRGGVLS